VRRPFAFLLVTTLAVAGCAFVPKANLRLEEARAAYGHAATESHVILYAPAELRKAAEMLERAAAAHDRLDDPALVDHLAYLAKQSVAIARETASLKASQPGIAAAIR